MSATEDTIAKAAFWNNLLTAVGTDPKSPRPIRGASGQYHDVLAVGVDDKCNRLVLVSGEHDARAAVLAQYDIQSAIKKHRVLTVRPAAVSLPKVALALQAMLGKPELTDETLRSFGNNKEIQNAVIEPSFGFVQNIAKSIRLELVPQFLQLIQQLAELRFDTTEVKEGTASGTFTLDFSRLIDMDPIAKDREFGICPIPLYDLSGDEVEAVCSATTNDDVVQFLHSRDIFQFFFPAPDSLAVGLVDRGVEDEKSIESEIKTTPALGHPLGDLEIVTTDVSQSDLLDALKEKGLIVEGEYGCELSDEGQKVRMLVKFKPKEGIISKLINRLSINIDLKDLFK